MVAEMDGFRLSNHTRELKLKNVTSLNNAPAYRCFPGNDQALGIRLQFDGFGIALVMLWYGNLWKYILRFLETHQQPQSIDAYKSAYGPEGYPDKNSQVPLILYCGYSPVYTTGNIEKRR